MIDRKELRFIRRAIEKGWISGEKVFEYLESMRAQNILHVSLRDVLLQRGELSWKQLREIEAELTPKAESEAHEGTGQKISYYEVLEQIGEGAMGSVYRARNTLTNRTVALKLLDPELARDPQFVERFLREAKNAAKLKQHENIVEAYDFGEEAGQYYFVMEFIKGRSLAEILLQKNKLEEHTALTITRQVARALQHANRFSIIHRDIKPENILISQDGVVKLCDLGLAKDTSQDCYKTSDGVSLGTASYIAPEQASASKNLDIRVDIYSLGITLYQMLTGELPFDGPNSRKIANQHISRELPPLEKKNPHLSSNVIRLVQKMTAKKPGDRYQNPDALLHDLEQLLYGPAPEKKVRKPGVTPTQLRVLTRKKTSWLSSTKWLYVGIVVMSLVLILLWLGIYFRIL